MLYETIEGAQDNEWHGPEADTRIIVRCKSEHVHILALHHLACEGGGPSPAPRTSSRTNDLPLRSSDRRAVNDVACQTRLHNGMRPMPGGEVVIRADPAETPHLDQRRIDRADVDLRMRDAILTIVHRLAVSLSSRARDKDDEDFVETTVSVGVRATAASCRAVALS